MIRTRWLAAVLLIAGCTAGPPAREVSGCWVHAFAGERFTPPVTTYTGPTHEPFFMKEAASLIVGPDARLEGFAGGGYRKETLDLGPGTLVQDLRAIDFDRRVDSFKVVCVR